MKFLPVQSLDAASSFITRDEGGTVIVGRIEAYSCKRVAAENKLCSSLESKLLLKSSGGHSVSPFGPLIQKSSRATLIDLICALNLAFPDYDFSNLIYGDYFVTQEYALEDIDRILSTNISNYDQIKNFIWDAVNAEILIDDCDIYSFNPEPDNDPFDEEGHLWNFNYFFYNRNLKKMLLFAVTACWRENKIEEEGGINYNDVEIHNDWEQFDMDVI